MIYRWCPLKWTNAKINILMCNANKSDVSTKVDKCENQWFLSCNAAERWMSTKVDNLKEHA